MRALTKDEPHVHKEAGRLPRLGHVGQERQGGHDQDGLVLPDAVQRAEGIDLVGQTLKIKLDKLISQFLKFCQLAFVYSISTVVFYYIVVA